MFGPRQTLFVLSLAWIRVGSAFVSIRIGSVRIDAVRRVLVCRASVREFSGPNCEDDSSEGFGTESDLELELVERPARFDCN